MRISSLCSGLFAPLHGWAIRINVRPSFKIPAVEEIWMKMVTTLNCSSFQASAPNKIASNNSIFYYFSILVIHFFGPYGITFLRLLKISKPTTAAHDPVVSPWAFFLKKVSCICTSDLVKKSTREQSLYNNSPQSSWEPIGLFFFKKNELHMHAACFCWKKATEQINSIR